MAACQGTVSEFAVVVANRALELMPHRRRPVHMLAEPTRPRGSGHGLGCRNSKQTVQCSALWSPADRRSLLIDERTARPPGIIGRNNSAPVGQLLVVDARHLHLDVATDHDSSLAWLYA